MYHIYIQTNPFIKNGFISVSLTNPKSSLRFQAEPELAVCNLYQSINI